MKILRRLLCQTTLVLAVSTAAMAQVPTESNTITIGLVPDPAGGRNLLLVVEATEVSDLYGLSFDLEFPKRRLRWKKRPKRPGSFLSESGAVETVVLSKQKPRGVLHVGVSRLGELPGVNGSGTVVEIRFVNRKKAGPRDLTLTSSAVFDSSGKPIEGIVWKIEPFDDGSDS